MGLDPILPTPEQVDAMPFAEVVGQLTVAVEHVIRRALKRAATRRSQGRPMSAADLRDLNALAVQLQALRRDAMEMLEPGTTEREIRAVIAGIEVVGGYDRGVN